MGRNSVVFSDSGDPHESLIFLPPDMFEGQIRRKPWFFWVKHMMFIDLLQVFHKPPWPDMDFTKERWTLAVGSGFALGNAKATNPSGFLGDGDGDAIYFWWGKDEV